MYEVESIDRLVKEIDPRFGCHFEHESEEYVITQTSPLGLVSWFDSIRYDQLNRAFFEHMRKVIYINRNGDPAEKAERDFKEMAAKQEEKRRETVHDLVKDEGARLYRALREA